MQKRIVSIFQLFPNFEEKINFLFQNDENFRDLCSDYILCTSMALERKKVQNANEFEIQEYDELQSELEKEILKEILKEKLIN